MINISIIVTTLNSSSVIRNLFDSLEKQTSNNFNVILIDGGSKDDTVEIVKKYKCLTLLSVKEGLSIYEGINLGIELCKTKYYVVCGSDDILFPTAIEILNNKICDNADLYIFSVYQGEKLVNGNKPTKINRLLGWQSIISSHSVGTLIKTELHEDLGYYDTGVSILADGLFLTKVFNNHNLHKVVRPEIIGKFSISGASYKNFYNNIFTTFIIQTNYFNFFLQLLILVYRLLKYRNYLKVNNEQY